MLPNQENFYWLFSSSAQTISAFVAFLITGFAVVLSMIDSLQKKDESLEDIHRKIKYQYYWKICVLAIVTGVAIVLNLLMVYLNGTNCSYKGALYIITVLFTIATTFFGIYFVLVIINPARYLIAAKELIKENVPDLHKSGKKVRQLEFMAEFIEFEKVIRDILKEKGWYIGYGETPKMAYSFRHMVEALLEHSVINKSDFVKMLEINKYRNLVFHGHQENVDSGILAQLNKMKKTLANHKNRGTD